MIPLKGKEHIFWSYQVFPLVKISATNYLNFSVFKENYGHLNIAFMYIFLWHLCNRPHGTKLKQV